jgi:hypothetical protein
LDGGNEEAPLRIKRSKENLESPKRGQLNRKSCVQGETPYTFIGMLDSDKAPQGVGPPVTKGNRVGQETENRRSERTV